MAEMPRPRTGVPNALAIVRALAGLFFLLAAIVGWWPVLRTAFFLMGLYILFTEVFTLALFKGSLRHAYLEPVIVPSEIPKFVLDLEKTLVQILIAVGAIGATLLSREVITGPLGVWALGAIISSVVIGVLYAIVSQGSVVGDKDVPQQGGTFHVLSVIPYHMKWKSPLLDVQVLLLIFGLAVLLLPPEYARAKTKPSVIDVVFEVEEMKDTAVREGDVVAVGSVLGIDAVKKQMVGRLDSVVERLRARGETLRRCKRKDLAAELESYADILTGVRQIAMQGSVVRSHTEGMVTAIRRRQVAEGWIEVSISLEPLR